MTHRHSNPIEYIHYAPYGELLAIEHNGNYREKYLFTGKERDEETGLDYFGARYYDSRLGFWMSVDPLADKYIFSTPYSYCNGNPIMLVDPDGKKTTKSFYLESENLETRKANIRLNNVAGHAPVDNINNDFTVVWAHGTEDGTKMEWVSHGVENGTIKKTPAEITANQLFTYLGDFNDSFDMNGDNVTILVSCNTGKNDAFGSEFSGYSGGIVIAPSNVATVNSKGELRVKDNGNWIIYKDGKAVDSIDGKRGSLEKFLSQFKDERELIQKYSTAKED